MSKGEIKPKRHTKKILKILSCLVYMDISTFARNALVTGLKECDRCAKTVIFSLCLGIQSIVPFFGHSIKPTDR